MFVYIYRERSAKKSDEKFVLKKVRTIWYDMKGKENGIEMDTRELNIKKSLLKIPKRNE